MFVGNKIQTEFWAMYPSAIRRFLNAKIPEGKIEAFIDDKPKISSDVDFTKDGIAIVRMHGAFMRDAGFLSLFMNIIDPVETMQTIRDLSENDDVNGIILHIDSPGGDVAGIRDLAETVYNVRGKKPIYAYTPWMMASAAYWVGAACDNVYTSHDSIVGSIGIIYTHIDVSEQDAMFGVKITELTSGKWKSLGSENKPLSDEDAEELLKSINEIAASFVGSVAKYRGLSEESVWGFQAATFSGAQAKEKGLIDDIVNSPFDLNSYFTNNTQGVKAMNFIEKLKAKYPDMDEKTLKAMYADMVLLAAEEGLPKPGEPSHVDTDDGEPLPTTEGECKAAGYYWYQDKCHKEPQKPDDGTIPDDTSSTSSRFKGAILQYDNKKECEDNNGYWWDDKCHDKPKESAELSQYTNKEECEKNGGVWDGEKCKKKESDNDTMDATVSFLSGRIRELEQAMEDQNKQAAVAIFESHFERTGLPEQLQEGIMGTICHLKFVKGGVLDQKAFDAAVRKKVNEWAGLTGKTTDSIGSSLETPGKKSDPNEYIKSLKNKRVVS